MLTTRIGSKTNLTLETDVVQDNIPIEVVPKLYIGSIYSALNEEVLVAKGITHILNASRFPSTFPNTFTYLSIDIRDKAESNILACIPTSNIFIEAGMDAGGILVHCYGGRSRSAALIAAFLMSSCNYSYDKVRTMLQQARSIVSINIGFERSLQAYGLTNYNVYAAQQLLLRSRIRSLHKIRDKIRNGIAIEYFNGSRSQNKSNWSEREKDTPPSSSSRKMQMSNVDAKSPHCRLSRPGSSSVRVIPPLRGLEREFSCSWCGARLFNLANVIRVEIDVLQLLDQDDLSCSERFGNIDIDSSIIYNL
jgi:hypothetical protein